MPLSVKIYLDFYISLFYLILIMNTYLTALEDARKELEGLIQERAQLDDRVARLAKSIEGLAALCDQTDFSAELKTRLIDVVLADSVGMSDAIRQIIASSVMPISATTIRDALVNEGFDPKNYSNMLTAIHNTLVRLEKQGEIQRASNFLGIRGWVKRGGAEPGGALAGVPLKPLTHDFKPGTTMVTLPPPPGLPKK